jgi:hypothetical protein
MLFGRSSWSSWTPYTPTYICGTGVLGNGQTAGLWRRLGDSVQYMAELIIGSTTTFQAGSLIILTMPPGLIRHSSKVLTTTNRVEGDCYCIDVSNHANDRWGVPFTGVSNNIGTIAESCTPTGITNTGGTTPFTWATGDRLLVSGTCPIAVY